MEVPEEVRNAALALGKSLQEQEYMRTYLKALDELHADAEAAELERQLYELYDDLIARQRAGEQLSHVETQPFFELRRKVQAHPLIARREESLRLLRPHLVEIAEEISAILGIDYTSMVESK